MANVTATAKCEIQDDSGKVIWGGVLVMTVPDSDPAELGAIWSNSDVLTVSEGP